MQHCITDRDYWENLSIEQDSLIVIQDSIITQYKYKDGLVEPFYKQEWFHNLMFTLAGVLVKDKIEEIIND